MQHPMEIVLTMPHAEGCGVGLEVYIKAVTGYCPVTALIYPDILFYTIRLCRGEYDALFAGCHHD